MIKSKCDDIWSQFVHVVGNQVPGGLSLANHPVSTAVFNDHLHVFAVGSDNAIHETTFSGAGMWSGSWHVLPGGTKTLHATCSATVGSRLYLIHVNDGGSLCYSSKTAGGAWEGWQTADGLNLCIFFRLHLFLRTWQSKESILFLVWCTWDFSVEVKMFEIDVALLMKVRRVI